MKNFFKISFLSLLFLGGFFSFQNSTQAAIQQPIDSGSQTLTNNSGGDQQIIRWQLFDGATTTTGTITRVDYYASGSNLSSVRIDECTSGAFTISGSNFYCSGASPILRIYKTNVLTGGSKTLLHLTSSDYYGGWNGTLTSGSVYMMTIYGQVDSSSSYAIYGQSGTYTAPQVFTLDANSGFYTPTILPYYTTNLSDTPASPTISINYPIDNSSLGGDFSHWQLNVSNTGDSSFTGSERIIYGESTSTMINSDWQGIILYANATSTIDYVNKSTPLLNKLIYAQGQILDQNNNIVASTTIISFDTTGNYLNYTGANAYSTPTSTISSASSTIECNTGNLISGSLCSVITWLFVPPQNVLDGFVNIGETVRNKPPFGYISVALTTWSNLTISSTQAVVLNPINGIFNPLITGLNWILWIVFGSYLIYRLKHLEI